MAEPLLTHHKIKAEWTKASKNEIFDNNSSSESDRLQIVEDESVSCQSAKAPAKIKILEQIVLYPSQKSVKCHFCDKNFDQSLLEEHQRIHQATFFDCPECDKKFKRKSSLRKHRNFLHKKKFKYKCQECDITFIDLTKFELHQNTKHKTKDAQPKFLCQEPDCGKTFASTEYLRRHQVTHSDDYKYKCTFCDQKFKWMTSLQVHQTIHTQNKTLVQCKICFKRFFNHRTLERHQKIHKNVKYKCMLCDKVISTRKDNIRRHIRHLHHTEVEKSEIASKIEIVESRQNGQIEEEDDEIPATEQVEVLDDEPIIVPPEPQADSIPEPTLQPQPIVSNRVNVIQSIGNPNRHQETIEEVEPVEVVELPPTPPVFHLPQEKEIQIKLPPKKKAMSISQSSSGSSASRPKYDPIEHYRKMLLGFSRDDDYPSTTEDSVEEEDHDQETQVFPVHWRKRTSQNFLFRR